MKITINKKTMRNTQGEEYKMMAFKKAHDKQRKNGCSWGP